jgi:hypothetical protein
MIEWENILSPMTVIMMIDLEYAAETKTSSIRQIFV